MRATPVDERDTTWESSDARYRVFVYTGPAAAVTAMDIVDASALEVLDSARAFSDADRNIWSLAVVVDDRAAPTRGLVWLSGMDYHSAPASPFEWRTRREMQNRYLSACKRRGEPALLPNGLRVVRMFPEWSVRWPLWESFTDNYPMDAAALGLSPSLSADLAAWNDRWQSREIDDPVPAGWGEEGWALYRRLQLERSSPGTWCIGDRVILRVRGYAVRALRSGSITSSVSGSPTRRAAARASRPR